MLGRYAASLMLLLMDGSRGGGVGLLYRNSIRNENSLPISDVQSTFEYQATSVCELYLHSSCGDLSINT
jgi:hypothetical protein